jgi:hypothetical protein
VKQHMYLVNNELMNIDHGLKPAVLPEAEVHEDTPFTGTLAFLCESAHHLAAVEHFLTARRASALMGFKGERVYLKAAAPIEKSGRFPQRLAIPVEFIDDPGPAIT